MKPNRRVHLSIVVAMREDLGKRWLHLVSYAKQVRLSTDTVDQGPLLNHGAYNTTQRPPLEMFYGGEMTSCKISIKIHYDIFRKLL